MDIGSMSGAKMSGPKMSGLEQELRGTSAQPVRGDVPRFPDGNFEDRRDLNGPPVAGRRKHGLWESITASLDLACRGYLCMQIVDCDPVSDPDCSASGKKVVVREVPGLPRSVDGKQ